MDVKQVSKKSSGILGCHPILFCLIAKENKKTQYLVLFERNTALAMYGAGEGNRTLIISLEG